MYGLACEQAFCLGKGWKNRKKKVKNRYLQFCRWMTLPYIMINQTINFITAKGIFFFHYFRFFWHVFLLITKNIYIYMLVSFSDKGCLLLTWWYSFYPKNNRFDLLSYWLIQGIAGYHVDSAFHYLAYWAKRTSQKPQICILPRCFPA